MVPGDIISGSSYLSVSFESDISMRGNGFEINYEATESQDSNTPVLNIYTIAGKVREQYNNTIVLFQRVRLHFFSFSLEKGCYDKVKVYDGTNSYAPLIRSLCDTYGLPEDITASGNVAFVSFTSDSSGTGAGFRIQYSAFMPAAGKAQ